MSELVVVCRQIAKAFGGDDEPRRDVLRQLDLELERGSRLTVMGPSGSGKSTLLHVLAGLSTVDAGSVQVLEQDLSRLSMRERCRLRAESIGLVFQDHHLLPHANVVENVLMPLYARQRRIFPEQDERARELLDRVGLGDRAESWPQQLSGGERQRVAVARALINDPSLVLADEPTGALDQDTALELAELLATVHEAIGATLVVVTHDNAVAERLGTIRHLHGGRLQEAA